MINCHLSNITKLIKKKTLHAGYLWEKGKKKKLECSLLDKGCRIMIEQKTKWTQK